MTIDIYPTVLELAGVKPLESLVDGISLGGLLKHGTKPVRTELFWHYPHYHPGGATPYSAIRSGDLRLVHFYEDGRDELFDLSADAGETQDLAYARPAQAKALRSRLDSWLNSVDAQLPTPNPAYDPTETSAPRTKPPQKR